MRVVVDRVDVDGGLELRFGLRRSGPSGSTRARAPRAPSPSRARGHGPARARSRPRARCRRRAGACPPGTRRTASRRLVLLAWSHSVLPSVGRVVQVSCGTTERHSRARSAPVARILALRRRPLRLRRGRRGARGPRRSTLRRVDDDEHAALEAAHPHNSVRLILPRDETVEGDRYARAAAAFATWQRAGRARRRRPRPASTRTGWSSATRTARLAHTRGRHRRARLPEAGDRRRAPPRAHAAEGEVRPARRCCGRRG